MFGSWTSRLARSILSARRRVVALRATSRWLVAKRLALASAFVLVPGVPLTRDQPLHVFSSNGMDFKSEEDTPVARRRTAKILLTGRVHTMRQAVRSSRLLYQEELGLREQQSQGMRRITRWTFGASIVASTLAMGMIRLPWLSSAIVGASAASSIAAVGGLRLSQEAWSESLFKVQSWAYLESKIEELQNDLKASYVAASMSVVDQNHRYVDIFNHKLALGRATDYTKFVLPTGSRESELSALGDNNATKIEAWLNEMDLDIASKDMLALDNKTLRQDLVACVSEKAVCEAGKNACIKQANGASAVLAKNNALVMENNVRIAENNSHAMRILGVKSKNEPR